MWCPPALVADSAHARACLGAVLCPWLLLAAALVVPLLGACAPPPWRSRCRRLSPRGCGGGLWRPRLGLLLCWGPGARSPLPFPLCAPRGPVVGGGRGACRRSMRREAHNWVNNWVNPGLFWGFWAGRSARPAPRACALGACPGALIDAMGLRVRGSFPAPPPAPRAGPLAGWAQAASLWWLRPLLLLWPAAGR